MIRTRMMMPILNTDISNNFIIVGAGKRGQQVLECLRETGKNILFFFDNNEKKVGTVIDGINVVKPYKCEETSVYIIAIDNNHACYMPVTRDIKAWVDILGKTGKCLCKHPRNKNIFEEGFAIIDLNQDGSDIVL